MSQGHYRHLLRAFVLLGGALFLFFIVRAFLKPRGVDLKEQAAIPAVHGAPSSCAECHDDQARRVASGPHATVPCQSCHAPLARHVTEEGMTPMPVTRSYTLCARCHQELEARPKVFPQIDLQEHVVSHGKEWGSEEICLNCHPPHQPRKR